MNLLPLFLVFTLSESPLIEKSGEITSSFPYFEMGVEEDLTIVKEERETLAAYKAVGFGSVTVFQREHLGKEEPFKLVLVPFNDNFSTFMQLFQVFKSLIWGAAELPNEQWEKEQTAFTNLIGQAEADVVEGDEKDVFCRQEVVDRQTLWEGMTVRLLYPTSVLPNEELAPHFMVVTKKCRPDFLALTEEEALEVELISRKVFQIFKERGYQIGIKLQKNGTVGITVPHFHQHLIFFKDVKEERSALYKMVRNVILGSNRLADEQFQKNYDFYRPLLENYLWSPQETGRRGDAEREKELLESCP